jgi:hypothetical protein
MVKIFGVTHGVNITPKANFSYVALFFKCGVCIIQLMYCSHHMRFMMIT